MEVLITVSDMFMPPACEVNPTLEEASNNVNTDPYGEGWMIKIKFDNKAEIDELLDIAAYKETLE